MDLREYITVLRERWVLITAIIVACVAAAAAITFSMTPKYESTTGLFISTAAAGDDAQANQGAQFSLQRVKSYADLVTKDEIARRVVDQLGLKESVKDLREQISAEAAPDTVILTITVEDPSAERAQRIAEATSDVFVRYVSELETPPGGTKPSIKATVINRAELPEDPSSPQPLLNLGVGLFVGLIVGVGTALLRETLDSTVSSLGVLEDIAGAPVIGAVPYDSDAGSTPLISQIGTHSPRSEAFRVLRTNLQFIDPDEDKKVFVITSALPGEGKTTTACNLALALAEGGQLVALVEADMRRPRVSQYLGVVDAVGLTTVLVGRVSLEDAMQDGGHPGLSVLTSGKIPPNPAELLQSRHMAKLIGDLRSSFDIVIIDAPPLLPVTDGALIASHVDGAVLVVRHGKTTADQVRGAVDRLEGVSAKPAAVVFNMTPQKSSRYGYGYGYGYAPDSATPPQKKKRFGGGRRADKAESGRRG